MKRARNNRGRYRKSVGTSISSTSSCSSASGADDATNPGNISDSDEKSSSSSVEEATQRLHRILQTCDELRLGHRRLNGLKSVHRLISMTSPPSQSQNSPHSSSKSKLLLTRRKVPAIASALLILSTMIFYVLARFSDLSVDSTHNTSSPRGYIESEKKEISTAPLKLLYSNSKTYQSESSARQSHGQDDQTESELWFRIPKPNFRENR